MYIYKITNKINDKVYIGQTINSIEFRWQQHYSTAKRNKTNTLFSNAIKKYGKENFIIEQIAIGNSIEDLNTLEDKFIKLYNSIAPRGYNLLTGGNNRILHKETKEKISKANKKRKVFCINLSNKQILHFDSCIDAAHILNIDVGAIWKACAGKLPSYKNYLWHFENTKIKQYNPKTNPRPRAVIGICKTTKKEVNYSSITSTEKDGFTRTAVSACCRGKVSTHKNFYWKYDGGATCQ